MRDDENYLILFFSLLILVFLVLLHNIQYDKSLVTET